MDSTVSHARTVAPRRSSHRWLATALSVIAVTWGAVLVFAVQPMLGRMLLPQFGGAPAVWLTALVFFQVALLLGYLYAHLLDRLPGRRQLVVYIGTAAAAIAFLPAGLPGWSPPSSAAAIWVLGALTVGAGLPYVVASATGPLLHAWYARAATERADPYFLYAASNAGSLGALLAYPILIEPYLDLDRQAVVWSGAFVVLGVVAVAAAVSWRIHREVGAGRRDQVDVRPGAATVLRWAAHAAVPSALLVGSTRYLTTDIAPVPLLWVIPLAVYLATFIVAFRPRRRVTRRSRRSWLGWVSTLLGSLVVLIAAAWQGTIVLPTWAAFVAHLAVLGATGAVAHGRLAQERPPGEQATAFLLAVAVGGAAGSVIVAIVAPSVLPLPLEYPLALAAALMVVVVGGPLLHPPVAAVFAGLGVLATAWLLPAALGVGGLTGAVASIAVATAIVGVVRTVAPQPVLLGALGLALLLPSAAPSGATLHAERTFFADHRVVASPDGDRTLVHGTTIHGSQDPNRPDVPTAYYHREGPVADLMALDGGAREIGVLGLGVGALAAYGGPDDRFTFFEIDPAVERIATDPTLFTYLHRTPSEVEVVIADGRLGVESAGPRAFDLLVVDAFTSDAIPVHLLTIEALDGYLRAVGDDAVVAINVSNRYLDLVPVVAAAAEDLGASVHVRADPGGASGTLRSRWVALAADDEALSGLGHGWSRPAPGIAWTDRSAPIWRAVDWKGRALR